MGPRFDGQPRPQFTGNDPWNAYPNNVKDFYETGFITNNNVAVFGANEKGNFRLSYTNIIQKGVIPNTGLKADRLDLSGGWQLSDKLHIKANVKLIDQRSDNNRSYDVRLYPRNIDIQALTDYWVPGLEGTQQLKWRSSENNPYFVLNENRNAYKSTRLIGNITANYQLTEKWSLMGRIGENRDFQDEDSRSAFSTVGPANKFGNYATGQSNKRELNADFLLRYQQDFGKDINAIFSFGGIICAEQALFLNSSVSQLLVPDIYNLGNTRVFSKNK